MSELRVPSAIETHVKLISPVDGSIYATRPYASPEKIAQAICSARKAQREWRQVSLAERARYCLAAVDAMLAMGDEIVPELAWQMGRPVHYGAGELKGFEERARYMIAAAELALQDHTPQAKPGFRRFIRREPLGLILTIAPWNYPYLTAVNSLIPGLMAGNAMILKHAPQTMLVGERYEAAFKSAGLPEGLFHNLLMDHSQTEALIRARLVDQVNFTGSVTGGAMIEQAAAGRFIGVGLELGGKDPAYVRADADLDFAIENLVDGAFFNSGQSCCGIERIYVALGIYPEFIERFARLTRDYLLGNPLDPTTTLGPLVSTRAANFVRAQIEEAQEQGARLLIPPNHFPHNRADSPYLAPQVLVEVNHQMRLMREESFGPVVGIMPVESDQEAIALMNDSDFGLTASVWTRDLARAEQLGQQLECGTFFLNRCDTLDPALAWTGVKQSGRGASLSALGYEQLTRLKSYHLREET